ncbi:MAG: hypothetical protein LBQ45_02810 [Mycoplasmataceae bacterium]|jgi:hypothetical protein|nr:hypothetical protein [Mycoplasmataceae bacterium]
MSKKDNIQVQNVIGNMALEGIKLDDKDIERITLLSNPDLSEEQVQTMAKKMKDDVLEEMNLK